MTPRAKVRSSEALEAFRASLIVYLEKAGGVLDEIGEEVRRTKDWLESDRQSHWRREVRHRTRILEERRQELFSARLSSVQEATQLQHMAVQKARRAVQEAEDRLRQIRLWIRQYDSRIVPLAREVEKLRQVFVTDLGQAVTLLGRTVRILEAYGESRPSGSPRPGDDRAPAAPDPAGDPSTGKEAGS